MTALEDPTFLSSYVPTADKVALSPAINSEVPPNRFAAWEPTTVEPSYTLLNEFAFRLVVVTTICSTTKEPTTVKLAKPILIGFAAEVTLYCPAFTCPDALKLVAVGINAVVRRPPLTTPSFKVNAVAPLVLKLIGLRSLPFVPI